jgi:aspartate racemase
MTERVVGVLGGMGPEATLYFYEKLIAHTAASSDQDHLRVVIDSNAKIPDRTAAILRGGGSPVPMMATSIEAIRRAGAEFVVIPCVSAHAFLAELQPKISLPVLSILDIVADHIRAHSPGLRRVGLLATSGTIEAAFLQRRLEKDGLGIVVPEPADQDRLMAAIYGIKASRDATRRAQISRDVRAVGERLVAAGAEGIVLGCTELPLVLGPGGLRVPIFDALLLLARAAISAAGREPIPEVRP